MNRLRPPRPEPCTTWCYSHRKDTAMALLDLQNMEPEHGHGGGAPASSLSLIGCISSVSFLVCL